MDPLSIIASSLTISDTVAQTLRTFSSLRKAPLELHSLVNDVSDFQAVIAEIQAAYTHRARYDELPAEALRTLARVLDKANAKLMQLKTIADRCVGAKGVHGRRNIFYRIRWTQKKDTVAQIRRELSEAKLDIIALYSAANSRDLSRVLLRVESMSIVTTPVGLGSIPRSTTSSETLVDDSSALSYLGENFPEAGVEPKVEEIFEKDSLPAEAEIGVRQRSTGQSLVTKSLENPANAIGICLQVSQMRSNACRGCTCNCHQTSQFRTPAHLDKFLGRLFVGYTALPFLSPSCNRKGCQRGQTPSLRLRYYFPSWFLMRVFTMMATISNIAGPGMVIKVPRACHPKADILLFAGNGNSVGIKTLFEHGLASPFDEEFGTGVSILQRAVDNRKMEVVRLLLAAGSDPFHEDRHGCTPVGYMLQLAFTGDVSERVEFNQLVRSLDSNIFDMFQLTTVHKIVLKLADINLKALLSVTTQEVNEPDLNGQTPLFWAATQGDSVAVELLLQHGADPHSTSKLGESPLHWAIEGKDNTSTKLLLQHGADPSAKNCYGTTPLHYSAWTHADPSIQLLPLLTAGAAIDAQNDKGQTPLHYAIWADMVWPAACLIQHHASLEIQDKDGYTPLLFALLYNRSNAVMFLIEAGANVLARTKHGETVLHLAAAHGDKQMFETLEQRLPHTVDTCEKNDRGYTAADVLQKRQDKTLGLVVAFEHLLGVLVVLDESETSLGSNGSVAELFSTPPEYADVVLDMAKLSVEKIKASGST